VRAVLDTNIIISAFLFPGGNPEKIMKQAYLQKFEMVLSPAMLDELESVLKRKFHYDDAAFIKHSFSLNGISILIKPQITVGVQRLVLHDVHCLGYIL